MLVRKLPARAHVALELPGADQELGDAGIKHSSGETARPELNNIEFSAADAVSEVFKVLKIHSNCQYMAFHRAFSRSRG